MAIYIIVVIAAFVVVVAIFGFIQVRLEKSKEQPRNLVERCSAQAEGIIEKVKKTPEGAKQITVKYEVNGVPYEITEQVGQYKEVNPEAKKRRDKILYKDYILCRTGYVTPVMYNPKRPDMAYLKDNKDRDYFG